MRREFDLGVIKKVMEKAVDDFARRVMKTG
jgi:hypothetical protein